MGVSGVSRKLWLQSSRICLRRVPGPLLDAKSDPRPNPGPAVPRNPRSRTKPIKAPNRARWVWGNTVRRLHARNDVTAVKDDKAKVEPDEKLVGGGIRTQKYVTRARVSPKDSSPIRCRSAQKGARTPSRSGSKLTTRLPQSTIRGQKRRTISFE
jgi:hypothetical protein